MSLKWDRFRIDFLADNMRKGMNTVLALRLSDRTQLTSWGSKI